MKFLHFIQFFGSFLPSLIRIQPIKIEAKFRIHPDSDPDPQHCFIVNDIVAHTLGNMKLKVQFVEQLYLGGDRGTGSFAYTKLFALHRLSDSSCLK
jgi:hypothetical protein